MNADMDTRPGLAQRVRRRAAGHWSDIRGLPRPQPLTASLKSRSAGLDLPREFPVEAYDELQRITERLNGDQVSAEELVDLLRRGKGLEAALREHLAEVELQVEAIERGEGVQRFTIASE